MNSLLAWLAVIALSIGGSFLLGWTHGEEEIKLIDAKAVAAATLKANAETAKLNDQLQDALNAKAQSDKALSDHIAAEPLDPVRLCLAPASPVPSPEAAAAGADGAAPAADGLQPVQGTDSGVRPGDAGPDLRAMLTALAERADEVTDQLRALQAAAQGR
jgi:hypothetical protein